MKGCAGNRHRLDRLAHIVPVYRANPSIPLGIPGYPPAVAQEFAVLFVCTGNICRSPTAEGVFRRKVEDAGLANRVQCDSAATHSYHIGAPPDPRAVSHAARRGYRLDSLRGRLVTPDDFRTFDLILAMDRDHYDHLARIRPSGGEPVADLRLFLGDGAEVPDPYYGGADDFERVLDLVEEACAPLIQEVRRRTSGTG